MSRRERGSMYAMMGVAILVLAVFGLGGAALGRIVAAKMDLQRASDAAALGGAEALRSKGRGQLAGALTLVKNNCANGQVQLDPVEERANMAIVPTRGSLQVEVPMLAMNQSGVNVQTQARAYVGQTRFTNVNPPHARVVLVLDYSGSMAGEKMALLKESVNDEALKTTFPIDWAAVLFDSTVLDKVDFKPLDPANVKQQISDTVSKHDAGAGTQTDAGLDQARDFLNHIKDQSQPNERYVLLVSDGVPNDPGLATAAAQKIWTETQATLITLLVGGDTSGGAWMQTVSGTPDKHPDPQWSIQATDPETLKKRFAEIIARIGCPLAPLPDAMDSKGPACVNNNFSSSCERIGGFLRPKGGGGGEREVPITNDLGSLGSDGYGFSYDPSGRKVTLSMKTCNDVHTGGMEFVVRYNRAKLLQ